MSRYYTLDGRTPVATDDVLVWAKFFENHEARRVASDHIGEVHVSTVFLDLDHAFGDESPVLFETMVFGGALDEECERCGTYDEAEAQHAAMCARVRGGA